MWWFWWFCPKCAAPQGGSLHPGWGRGMKSTSTTRWLAEHRGTAEARSPASPGRTAAKPGAALRPGGGRRTRDRHLRHQDTEHVAAGGREDVAWKWAGVMWGPGPCPGWGAWSPDQWGCPVSGHSALSHLSLTNLCVLS